MASVSGCFYVLTDEMMFTTAWYHRPVDVLGSKPAESYSDVRVLDFVLAFLLLILINARLN